MPRHSQIGKPKSSRLLEPRDCRSLSDRTLSVKHSMGMGTSNADAKHSI